LQADEFADVAREVGAFAVVDGISVRRQAAAFAELPTVRPSNSTLKLNERNGSMRSAVAMI
jgi:hypothetical protein